VGEAFLKDRPQEPIGRIESLASQHPDGIPIERNELNNLQILDCRAVAIDFSRKQTS